MGSGRPLAQTGVHGAWSGRVPRRVPHAFPLRAPLLRRACTSTHPGGRPRPNARRPRRPAGLSPVSVPQLSAHGRTAAGPGLTPAAFRPRAGRSAPARAYQRKMRSPSFTTVSAMHRSHFLPSSDSDMFPHWQLQRSSRPAPALRLMASLARAGRHHKLPAGAGAPNIAGLHTSSWSSGFSSLGRQGDRLPGSRR